MFKVLKKDKKSKARVGQLVTPHGTIDTPAFVPVGTQASVKSLTPQDLREIGVQVLFGNTYHLHLRPGEDIVKKFGGLAKFMGWNGVTMTDSGGFQVFSLARSYTRGPAVRSAAVDLAGPAARQPHAFPTRLARRGPPPGAPRLASPAKEEKPTFVKITDDGVKFRSHLDGSLHEFTPEKSIEIQKRLGADIMLAFDECPPYPCSYEDAKKAMERTHRWAVRSLKHHHSTSEEPLRNTSEVTRQRPRLLRGGLKQALFGVVQGGVYQDLREESARFISKLDFDGIAIGGVAVGESKKEMRDVLKWVQPFLPEDKPRHLLGVGEVDDIFEAIEWGMDMFDCVIPTRLGRMGFVLVSPPEGNVQNRFRIDIQKSKFAKDRGPIAKDCNCNVCSSFTRGYLNHLFRARELLAYRLATYHNLYFITNLVKQIREAIIDEKFGKINKEWLRA